MTKINAKHRRNLIVRWIIMEGGSCSAKKIVSFAQNNHNFMGSIPTQVAMILSHLRRKGVLKRYGNIFEIIA